MCNIFPNNIPVFFCPVTFSSTSLSDLHRNNAGEFSLVHRFTLLIRKLLFPSANEGWGKIMFCLCLSFCSQGGLPTEGLPKGDGQTPTPESENWAVRILMECFLIGYTCFCLTLSIVTFLNFTFGQIISTFTLYFMVPP